MATPTPCLMLMLNHWIILIFIFSECLASRAITWRAVRAINSTGPSYVSHYVKFWAVLGNEVKMMHFNHLNEPAKTRIRNSIQVHCNMQLVFGGHTFRKIFLWVNISLQNKHKNVQFIFVISLIFRSPHSIKLSCSDLGWPLTVQWGWRGRSSSELSSQSAPGCHSGHTWRARSGLLSYYSGPTSGHKRAIVTGRIWSFSRANAIFWQLTVLAKKCTELVVIEVWQGNCNL